MPKLPTSTLKRAESIDSDATTHQVVEGGAIPTSALDLQVCEVDLKVAEWLNEQWHSVLPIVQGLSWGTRKIAYTAMFNKLPWAIAIWTTPIAANRLTDGFEALELRRLAIHDCAPKNTASRMLSIMYKLLVKKWPSTSRLVSYQAVDHHAGTIYKAAGWESVAFSESETWHVGEKRADMQIVSAKVRWEKKVPRRKFKGALSAKPMVFGRKIGT